MLQRTILGITFLMIATILIPLGFGIDTAGSEKIIAGVETNFNSDQDAFPHFVADGPINAVTFPDSFQPGEESEEEEETKAENLKAAFGSVLCLIYSPHQANSFRFNSTTGPDIDPTDTPLFLFYGVLRL